MISQDTLMRGLRTDEFETSRLDQSSSFVLNATYGNVDGDSFKIQNEEGNQYVYSAPYTVIGTVNVGRRKTVVFSASVENQSEIGVVEDGEYTTLVNDLDLKFNTDHPIKGLYKTLNGCETFIYFHDGINPDRVINIDKLDNYKNLDGSWNIDKLTLQPSINIPTVRPVEILESGGNLEAGKYYFVIEILDNSLNPVQKSILSDGVNIYNSSIEDPYTTITGNANIDNTLAADGGQPPSTKSIRLIFENLDVNYPYIKLFPVIYNTSDATTAAVFEIGTLIPITGESVEYVFNTIDPNSDLQSDLAYVTTRNPIWTTSQDMKIVNDRLVRANLRGLADIDYSKFQSFASQVIVNPVLKEVDAFDASLDGNSKNPLNYSYFQYGETYALGIVYVFKQGFYSPVFHIPGREATDEELQLVELTEDKPHYGKKAGEFIEQWKIKYTTPDLFDPDGPYTPRMSYYETETKYPNIKCGNNYIYGNLVGQNIRHHRFPDFETSRFFLHSQFNPLTIGLGIRVTNVQYPHPDIVGHYIVYGKRDPVNRNVVDTVAFTRLKPEIDKYYNEEDEDNNVERIHLKFLNQDYNYVGQGDPEDAKLWTKYLQFFSPKTLFDKNINLTGKYIRHYYHLNPDNNYIKKTDYADDQDDQDIDIKFLSTRYSTINPGLDFVSEGNDFRLERVVKVQPNQVIPLSTSIFPESVVNRSQYNTFNIAVASDDLRPIPPISPSPEDATTRLRMGLLKQTNWNIHANLFAIQYTKITSELLSKDSQVDLFGGDTYIAPLSFFSIWHEFVDSTQRKHWDLNVRYLRNIFFQSEVNVGLRHGGTISSSIISDGLQGFPYEFVLSKFGDLDTNGNYSVNPKPIQFYYNKDYSVLNPTPFGVLPLTYDYCSKCLGYYPNHIVWSDTQFVESVNDEFRSYLNENYTIVGEDTGEISGLYYDGKTLWVHTWESLYALYPNPQQLQTDVSTVYLGTGDFLALPPNQFSKTDYGYAGSQGRFAQCDTEFGRFYVDSENGTVFLISPKGPQELSSKQYGNQNFLRDNLPISLPKDLYPYISTDSIVSGVGIKCSYDPFHKRVFIYKKDYYPINYVGIYERFGFGFGGGLSSIPKTTGLYFSSTYNSFLWVEAKTQQLTFVKFADPDYFENRSFSISFSFELMAWASFHSWLPTWVFNDAMHVYSCQGKDVWKHDSKIFNTFYNNRDPFIIEYIATSENLEPSDIDNIDYYAYTKQWNGVTKSWSRLRFPTFDKMIVYTDDQSSGELKLIPKDTHLPFFRGDEATVAFATDHYRVNQIYNMSTDVPNFTSAWNSIRGQFFIDKVPININPNLSQYYITPIKSRFWKVRLFYNSTDKIIVDLIRTLHRNRSL